MKGFMEPKEMKFEGCYSTKKCENPYHHHEEDKPVNIGLKTDVVCGGDGPGSYKQYRRDNLMKDKPVEKREWCSHILWQEDDDSRMGNKLLKKSGCRTEGWVAKNIGGLHMIPSEWDQCPFAGCHAHRPIEEKRERLADILHDCYIGRTCSTRDKFNFVAQTALTAVIEVWERFEETGFHESGLTFPDYLKKELMEGE